jgi:tRNA nucleotidyltransferase (CCA-adding enzyme)
MVTGIPKDAVAANLRTLAKQTNGYTNFKGKDFGVFRFRYAGSEVEISLPRLERSTGDGHRDFDVEADHTLSPEADLYRRDFTANAIAVNLHTAAVLDPYSGAADIASGTLRVLNDDTFIEDPLRILRGRGGSCAPRA